MPLTQDPRTLNLKTPLGDNELLLTGFEGTEGISQLFTFHLDMISDNNAVTASDIVGKDVTFHIKLADDEPRFFHGFVNRFFAGDEDEENRRNYRAQVVPWFWFLTLTTDCRIFQEMNVKEIIEQIFDDLGFSDYDTSQIKGHHPTRTYCVQYRESDYDFVARLCEEEGIFWFFEHDDGVHKLILSDATNAYVDCQENEVDFPRDFGSRAMEDYITTWEHRYEFRTGKFAQTDYNFETPSSDLMTTENTIVDLPGMDKYEQYDFPGVYGKTDDGQPLTKTRMEEQEVGYDVVEASSLCKTFTPGGKFKIREHRSSSEEGNSYVITQIAHRASEPFGYEVGASVDMEYTNGFQCIPDSVVFRPPRTTEKPIVHGNQTAIVVGPSGEEIYPDEFGRVKVQFHWDREGKNDENSSCWMRVSQVHAGKNYGGIDIPRIGDEVIVGFLEGDPDQPIIVGRVYHAENMPPFGLPDSKTISGMKTKTYKGDGYNEYVLDDTPGEELIREHGQFDKDSTIENDLREHVLNDRSRDVANNETISVGNDRGESVGNNESLAVGNDRTEEVGNNETLTVGSNRTRNVGGNESVTVAMMRTHNVGINEMINVGAAQEITIGGLQAISVGVTQAITVGTSQTISTGTNQTVNVGGNHTESVSKDSKQSVAGDRTVTVGKEDMLTIGKKLIIDAGDQITIKTGKASITMKKDGTITIEGKDITINGKGKITGKAKKDMVLKGKNILQN